MATAVKKRLPLVAIVGPTASGKTGLAIRLAQEFGGEIISADSRAMYRGLSIGTAKPSLEERQGIPHWGIDIVDPGERFTAADFKAYAVQKTDEIRSRGHIPIIVGGTGLYVDAVLYDYHFPGNANDTTWRDELMSQSLEELYKYCKMHNIELPENAKNKRYVVNNILRAGVPPQRKHKLDENTFVVGITTEKEILRRRIEARADTIVDQRVVAEAITAASRYGWESEAMTGNIYPLIRQYINGEFTMDDLKRQFVTRDWRLAKRQLTWLKRNPDIQWFDLEHAYTYLARELEKTNKP